MTLLKALTISNNIVAIKTFQELDSNFVLQLAKKFGISRNLQNYQSLPLGVAEATVEENAAAFNVFANNGYYVKPYLIQSVYNKFGEKLYENTPQKYQVLGLDVVSKMINALSIRMQKAKEYGSSRWIDSESIGKTGSTNSSTTTWFVGATPQITTAIYIGFDDNRSLGKNIYASHTSYPLWLEFHRQIRAKKKCFYIDPKLKEVLIDWNNGAIATKQNENTVKILK
jgi:penicillin-binding protein 1A